MRRILVLTLPLWATECVKRRDPKLGSLSRPFALYERCKGALRLAAVDALAANLGLAPGHSLSDARARIPELEVREIEPALLEAVFADLADWHSYASPLVSVVPHDAPWGDLALDITGVSHLFGSEEALLEQVTGRLRALGYTAKGAVGPTLGAAWALARFAPGLVLEGAPGPALAALPVAALRLSEAQVSGLSEMGLKWIGQLYGRNRKALQARFGASLPLRLDQALGEVDERITPRLPVPEREAEQRFAEPIGLLEDVLLCTRDLAIRLSLRLEKEGLGAQAFHLFLYRVDHKVMALSVNAARPTREAEHVLRLFSNRAERLEAEYDPGFGIDMIRLAASAVGRLDAAQVGAFEAGRSEEDLDRLYDRMTSRLGPLAVLRTRFADTHTPERAVRLEPAIAAQTASKEEMPDLQRPLRLLPRPESIRVIAEVPDSPPAGMVWRRVRYRFVKASGPERIAGEWWRSRLPLPEPGEEGAEPSPEAPRPYAQADETRDYFIAEDDGGRRFWLFRQGLVGGEDQAGSKGEPAWFLHGFFA